MRLHAHMTRPAVPTAQPHQAASLPPPAAPRQPRFDANLTMRATQAAVGGRAREVCSHVRARLTFASVRSLSMHSSPPASILPLRARAVSTASHAVPACRCVRTSARPCAANSSSTGARRSHRDSLRRARRVRGCRKLSRISRAARAAEEFSAQARTLMPRATFFASVPVCTYLG